MGGGKCQLCMKESAAIERTWRRTERRVIRREDGDGVGRDGYPPRGRRRRRERDRETRGTGDKLCVCVCLLKKSQVT